MSDSSLDRRKFLGYSAVAGAAWATFGRSFKALASAAQVACRKISYPGKGLTMGMHDIGEIGKIDSIILEFEVMQAQNACTASVLVNQVIRLGGLPDDPINLLLKAQKAATLAQREAPKSLRDQWVLAALCKDIGKIKSPNNPSAFTASALRPYIDDSIYQVLKVYATFEDHPSQFANRPWYQQALQFLDWNERAVSEDFVPGSLDGFAKAIKRLVHVGPISGHPPDSKVIPQLEA